LGSGTPPWKPAPRGLAARSAGDGVADAVYAEQVAGIFHQMPIALVVNLVNAGLVAAILTSVLVWWLPLLWFGAVVLVTIGRAVLWWRYRSSAKPADPRRWSTRATLGASLAGLAWGLGGALFFPLVPASAQLFLTIVIGGMCAGAVVLSASHLPTLLGFLLAACLPMAARFLAKGTPDHGAVGAMIVVFAVAMAFAGRHLSHILAETMRLGFELGEANQRLNAEIAERKATEAALNQAQKLEALGQLTGGIAHDFNNILAIIINNLNLVSKRLGENSSAAPLIAGAVQAADRGVALIQRLLGFARKQHLDPQPVELARLIVGIQEMVRQTLGPKIKLSVDVPRHLAPAEVDPNQLELAILNLATNARDAMPRGGTLQIGLAERRPDQTSPPELASDDYLVISLCDTGTGMDDATLARAVEPFFTTKKAGVGTGLGLPMVLRFVARSGGAMRMSSVLGKGTKVELWLPRARVPAITNTGPNPSTASEPQGTSEVLKCDNDSAV
jgi:signal transduction histidine kinase